MKCIYELSCDGEVYVVNKNDGTSICKNHYSLLIRGHSEIKEKYRKINEIIRDIEDTFIEFQDTLINIKASIDIFKSNKAALLNYKDLLDEISKAEKHLDYQISNTIKHATESLKADSYQIYQMMKREMDLSNPDIEKIHDLCKQVIYKIFNDNLMLTLNNVWSDENEEFKYDPYLLPSHPIFGKKLTIFTMVCQDSK